MGKTEIIEIVLNRYSEFLENNGYMDSDWRDETPQTVSRFIEKFNYDVNNEIIATILSDCVVKDGKIVYGSNCL